MIYSYPNNFSFITNLRNGIQIKNKIRNRASSTSSTFNKSYIEKPLTRANLLTLQKFDRGNAIVNNSKNKLKKNNNSGSNTIKQRRFFTTYKVANYSYQFPKIPRPKRNTLYYRPNIKSIKSFVNNPKRFINYSTKKTTAFKLKKKYKPPLPAWFTLTSISIIFYGTFYKLNQDYDENDETNDQLRIKPTSWALYLYSTLPLKAISRVWGEINNINLPVWLRGPSFKLYSYLFNVNLDDMENPNLEEYHNLSEFFYRSIKPEVRPIDKSANLVSPCDGKILKLGKIDENGDVEQVKGMTYPIDAFLGTTNDSNHKKLAAPLVSIEFDESHHNSEETNHKHEQFYDSLTFENDGDKSVRKNPIGRVMEISNKIKSNVDNSDNDLFIAVIYLAPGDYHRFHSPTNWVTTLRRHFVGELYSVAPFFQKTFKDLFVLQERVALLGYWKYGFFSMTPVGATNVGSIKLNFDKDLKTNELYEHESYAASDDSISTATTTNSSISSMKKRVKKNTCYEATYAKASKLLSGQPLLKGEEIGGFKLGSTIVLVFEAPKNFKFQVKEGEKVKLGEKLGNI